MSQQFAESAGKTITCKAAICWGEKQPLKVEEIQMEPPRAHEVRIKMAATSVCHTDVVNRNGYKSFCNEGTWPVVYGHEGSGVVESVGESVTKFKPGDHVVIKPLPECGQCDWCKSGKTNRCPKNGENLTKGLMEDGSTRFHKDGKQITHFLGSSTYSEYTVCMDYQVAKMNSKAAINDLAPIGCCLPTGYGTSENYVKKGDTVGVWGLGAVGLCAILGARNAGASKIVAIDVRDDKLARAKEFGATEWLNPKNFKPEDGKKFQDMLREKYNGGFDVAIECCGAKESYEQCIESTHEAWGKTLALGILTEPLPLDMMQFTVGRTLTGCALGNLKTVDFTRLSDMYADGKLPEMRKLFSHHYVFNEETINKAFEMIEKSESIRTLLVFD